MNVSEALSGANAKTEGGFRQLQKTDPREMAKAMLADKKERDGKTILTWNRENAPLVPNDRMVGEINFNLPYMKIVNKYVIQNGKIYLMNGITQKTIEEVRKEDPENFHILYYAYKTFKNDAVKKDPRLCKDCIAIDKMVTLSSDSNEVLEHLVAFHPDKVLAASRAQVQEEAPPEIREPMGPRNLPRCGKRLPKDTLHGKRLHELRCSACKAIK